MGRHLFARGPEHRQIANGSDGGHFPTDRREYDLCRLASAVGHVYMRKRVEPDDRRRGLHPQCRVVAMKIVGDNDRSFRPNHLTNRSGHISVGVVDPINHHRPVQVQHHTIAWPRGTDTFKQQPHHVLERGLFHATGWLGSHIDNRLDVNPSGSRLVQIATVNCARPQVHLTEQISALKVITTVAVALEITQRCGNGGEGVCFVLDSSTDNSHFTPHTTRHPQELDTNEQMGHQLPPIARMTPTRQLVLGRSPQCGRQQ